MGSGGSIEIKVAEYQNPLVHERPEQPPIVEVMFQLAVDASGTRVIVVPDESMQDGNARYNPFLRLKQEYEEAGQVVCLEHVHVHQMKNTTGCDLTVSIKELFSLPREHALVSGCPESPPRLDEGRPHPDLTNKLEFAVPANANQFIHAGVRVYKKRVGDGMYEKWAGMDRAFDDPVETAPPPAEGAEEEEEEALDPPPLPEVEVFQDAHALIRALRMYGPSMNYPEGSWTSKKGPDGQIKHKVPSHMAADVRRKMRNTFFQNRRYTTFHNTNVSVNVPIEVQEQLNERWLAKLQNPSASRPVIQAFLSLTLLAFGEGDHKMNVIRLTL